MKLIYPSKILIPICCILFGISSKTMASHTMPFELTYRHLTGDTYEFTLVMYRNCLGSTATAPVTIPLATRSNSLGLLKYNVGNLIMVSVAGNGTQPPSIYNCTLAQLCIEEYVYRGVVNLALVNPTNPKARDWVFFYDLCCKPTGVMAYNNVTANNVYADCGLNNLDFPNGNDAPIWHDRYPIRPMHLNDTIVNFPFRAVCADRFICLEENVVDFEGDIMKYELIQPRSAGGAPEPYIGSYSLADPVSCTTPPGFKIDSLTGEICFEPKIPPTGGRLFLVTIKATESRMDTEIVAGVPTPVLKEIGYVTRDLALYYEPAASCPGSNIGLTNEVQNVSCADTSISVSISNYFQCKTADTDASFIELTDSATSTPLPVSSVSVGYCTNGLYTNTFKVNLPVPLAFGTYYLTLKNGLDANTIVSLCGTAIPEYDDTLKLIVDSVPVAAMLGSKDMNGQRLPFISSNCGQTTINVELNANVRCSSINPAGGDFLLFDSTVSVPILNPVISAVPQSCAGGLTKLVKLTFANPLKSGIYILNLIEGPDGNTLLNECGEISLLSSIQVRNPKLLANLGPDFFYCKNQPFQAVLEAPDGYASYSWNTGQTGRQIIVSTKGTYWVTISNGFGCEVSDTIEVKEKDCAIGITESAATNLALYPNPSHGQLFVSNSGPDQQLEISIRNVKGEEVLRTNLIVRANTSGQIDVSTFSSGIYVVQLSAGGQILKSEKVVVK